MAKGGWRMEEEEQELKELLDQQNSGLGESEGKKGLNRI
jgi:hypothetical protein